MTRRIRCVIVDDEYGAVEILAAYAEKVPWLEVVKTFTDPLEALHFLDEHPVDLLILDINMPDFSGMHLARLQSLRNTQIIFCTAYAQHAVESYEIPALDYLLKPVPFDRFLAAINKLNVASNAAESRPESRGSIFVKSGSHIHQVDPDQIRYIKKDGHYVVLKLAAKELVSRMTFPELLEHLPSDKFLQVHRSYVVSLSYIETIHKQFIKIGEKEIPIGDAFREDFFKKVDYSGR